MAAHLKRKHNMPQSPATSASSAATPSREPRLLQFFPSPLAKSSTRAKSITDALSFFLCKSIQPYSITANEGFKYLLEVLEPRYSIPDRKVFSDKLVPALYEKVKMDVVDSMSRAQRVSITVDGWTSCATDSYITVTAHYVTEEWDLQSHVLQTRVFNASHTGANLAALLQNVLREWNITDKNPALVTDNARNMVVAGAGADVTPHVRCVAHTLNLASQKALKMDRVSELLVKVRKVVTYFHKSPQAAEVLREIQSQLHLPNHKLIHDVCTRWNSSVDMLERFWEQQPALLNAMLSRRIRRGEGLAATAVNEDDMRLIQEIIKLMSPVKVATTLLSEEKSPTISMIAPIQAKLHKHFSEDNTDMPIIAEMKRRFRQDFFDRYVELQELLNSASALDPRFKDLTFLDDVDSRDLIFVKITAEVVKMNEKMKGIGALDEGGALDDGGALDEGGAAEGGGDRSPSIEERRDDDVLPSPKKKTAMDQLFGEFVTTRTPMKTTREKAKDEILKYRERDSLELGGDVLQWSFNIEEDMDPNLPGSSSSNSTLPLPGPSTQTTEVWKTAAPSEAVRLFMEDLRRGGDHQPPLRLTLNAGDTDEERDGTLISFYKQRRETCQWAADFRCSILGDAAVGVGVMRNTLSTAISKLTSGFKKNMGNAGVTAIFEGQREHLVLNLCTAILESDLFAMAGRMVGHSSIHGGPSLSGLSPAVLDALTRGTKDIVTSKLCLEDCPEIEVRDTISLLLKEEWTEAESVRVADLCTEWYFPVPTKETNRLLLFQQLLSHAVLGRANAQIKQFRKGIKETGIWPLLTARPDVLPLLFPRETDVELTPQMVLKCIIWPEASIDSDDSEDEMSTTNINLISGFFRAFVKEASSDVLKGLMKFWTGWELPSPRLTFKVVRSRGHHHLPTASTCYEQLRIPDHYKSGSALKLDLHACIESVQSGFGLI
ncbi:hypothetical protein D5F01_LYC24564 [Larimichthys crocea]|uniref:HECT domain-containing protein n=1 Tax=Larimichthys crocea TaxID=215358 RepID=A0A6G0HEN4_LARCR|nr:hypothetical protein D5F01_LYC24564 [Larimichthys crocea]